jgi:adenosylcobinamide-GDP ribazoletransferase
MNTLIRPLLMAIALLTRVPVVQYLSPPTSQYSPVLWSDRELGISALWYPMVGVVIAVLLMCLSFIFPAAISPWVAAALLLCFWVAITGALHLDGLADCVDAIYAGHALQVTDDAGHYPRREKIIAVLKDPAAGVMAVVVLCLLLFVKLILLASLWPNLGVSLLLALVIARAVALLFIVTTPYSAHTRSAGLGAVLAVHTPKVMAWCIAMMIAGTIFFLLPLLFFIPLILSVGLFLFMWRRYWIKTLDGFVGDALGALIEIIEVWVLLLLYCLSISSLS